MPLRKRTSRALALALAAGCLAAAATGCASSGAGTGSLGTAGAPAGSVGPGGTGATTPPANPTTPPAPATTATTHKPAGPALTCDQLRSAEVGSKTVSYNGYHDSIPLGGGGVWSGEDGNTVTLAKPCGIGDLDGDGASDAVGAVVLTSGGTGQFWTLVVWRNDHGNPVCVAVSDFPDGNDRTPVQSISISGGEVTVVYLTRTSDAPMVQLNIKRTATYEFTGGHLEETGHLDITYGG